VFKAYSLLYCSVIVAVLKMPIALTPDLVKNVSTVEQCGRPSGGGTAQDTISVTPGK